MPRGIDNVPERGTGSKTNYIKLLEDGESCRIRFITEGDQIVSDYFHRVMKGKQFKGFTICKQSLDEDCEDCDDGDQAQLQFLAWVWEYDHFHTEDGQNRTKIKIGSRTFYKEEVNEVKLMRYAAAHLGSIKSKWERNQTITDRDFEWIRSGPKGDNRPSYTLEGDDPTKLSKAVKEAAADIEDLETFAKATAKSTPKTVNVKEVEEDDEDSPF